MAAQDLQLRPTVKLVHARVKDEGEDKVYQSAALNNYTPTTLKTCAPHALVDIKRQKEKMQVRLEWSDVKMLRAILVLDTKSWQTSPVSKRTCSCASCLLALTLGWQGSLSVIPAKARNKTEWNRIFLPAVEAAKDCVFPLGTHLAAVRLLSPVPKSACQQA